MSIAKKREEILRLIAKVNSGSTRTRSPPTSQTRQGPDQVQQSSRDHEPVRLARRKAELAEIKKRRQKLESELVEERMLSLYEGLEHRLASIEEALEQRGPARSLAARTPTLVPIPGLHAAPAGPEAILRGKIQEGFLADILQLITSNMMTGVFNVESGDAAIQLYFQEGEIWHAEGEDLAGETAFFAAMAMEQGAFSFVEGTEPPMERTIESKTQFLILEALRQIDEQRAQGGEN